MVDWGRRGPRPQNIDARTWRSCRQPQASSQKYPTHCRARRHPYLELVWGDFKAIENVRAYPALAAEQEWVRSKHLYDRHDNCYTGAEYLTSAQRPIGDRGRNHDGRIRSCCTKSTSDACWLSRERRAWPLHGRAHLRGVEAGVRQPVYLCRRRHLTPRWDRAWVPASDVARDRYSKKTI
jgi:hypothetical protein